MNKSWEYFQANFTEYFKLTLREKVMIKSKKRQVFVVGGTHGNEFTGVYLIKKLKSLGLKENYKNISPFFELGNEEAGDRVC